MADIFRDTTKSVPTQDSQIVRVDMETQDIGGRKSSLPKASKSNAMSIDHTPNAGTK